MADFLNQEIDSKGIPFSIDKRGGIVYLITNKITGDTYIGATRKTIKSRWKRHRNDKKRLGSPLHKAMVEYKSENFKIEHIASALDLGCIAVLEYDLIAQYKPTYNRIASPDDIWSYKKKKVTHRQISIRQSNSTSFKDILSRLAVEATEK